MVEIPHFAALRGTERELVVMRSEGGDQWKEHHCEHTEEELNQVLNGMDEGERPYTRLSLSLSLSLFLSVSLSLCISISFNYIYITQGWK